MISTMSVQRGSLPWTASKFCILYNSRSPTPSWTALMIARGLQCVGGVTRSDSVLSQGAASHSRSRSDEVLGAQIRKRAVASDAPTDRIGRCTLRKLPRLRTNSLGPGSSSFISTSARLCDRYVARDALIACGLFGCNVDGLDV